MTATPRYLPTPLQDLLLTAALESAEPAAAAADEWFARTELEHLDGASLQLLPLVYGNLRRLDVAEQGRAPLRRLYRSCWLQNQQLLRHLPPVLGVLEEAEIPVLVHKGAALTSIFYGDAAVRPMADLDVLVATRQRRDAISALREVGWSSSVELARIGEGGRHAIQLAGPGGAELDLHWNLLVDSRGETADEDFWAASVPFPGASEARTLCDADHLLQTLVHGVCNVRAATIRWIADAVTIIRRGAVDWDRLFDQAEKRQVVLIVREGLEVVSGRFTLDLPVDLFQRSHRLRVTLFERLEFAEKRAFGLLSSFWRSNRGYPRRSSLRSLATFPVHTAGQLRSRGPVELLGRFLARLRERAGRSPRQGGSE